MRVKEDGMFSLAKILLPVDFSELCLEAARRAVPTLSKQFNSEVTVLHVLPSHSEFGGSEMGISFSGDLVTGMKD